MMIKQCPSFGSSHIVKNGTIHNKKQKYQCQTCKRQFVPNNSVYFRVIGDKLSLTGLTLIFLFFMMNCPIFKNIATTTTWTLLNHHLPRELYVNVHIQKVYVSRICGLIFRVDLFITQYLVILSARLPNKLLTFSLSLIHI